jgi:hypothetical protein
MYNSEITEGRKYQKFSTWVAGLPQRRSRKQGSRWLCIVHWDLFSHLAIWQIGPRRSGRGGWARGTGRRHILYGVVFVLTDSNKVETGIEQASPPPAVPRKVRIAREIRVDAKALAYLDSRIVRQRCNFTPSGSIREIEDYTVDSPKWPYLI